MNKLKDDKMSELREYMDRCKERCQPEAELIAILHKAQELYGYLPREVMDEVAFYMKIPTAHVWGVATFYHYFNLSPVGDYIVSVCMGTACYVKGAVEVLEALKQELGIKVGQTTGDGMFTLQEARCLGACGLAPVVMVNDKIHGGLDRKKTIELIREYRKAGKEQSAQTQA